MAEFRLGRKLVTGSEPWLVAEDNGVEEAISDIGDSLSLTDGYLDTYRLDNGPKLVREAFAKLIESLS